MPMSKKQVDTLVSRMDAIAQRMLDVLNEVSTNARTIKISPDSVYREIASHDLANLMTQSRNLIELTRQYKREELGDQLTGTVRDLASNISEHTGIVPSVDINGPEFVQVESYAQINGKPVLYVHADGVTVCRISNFQGLMFKDSRPEPRGPVPPSQESSHADDDSNG